MIKQFLQLCFRIITAKLALFKVIPPQAENPMLQNKPVNIKAVHY